MLQLNVAGAAEVPPTCLCVCLSSQLCLLVFTVSIYRTESAVLKIHRRPTERCKVQKVLMFYGGVYIHIFLVMLTILASSGLDETKKRTTINCAHRSA